MVVLLSTAWTSIDPLHCKECIESHDPASRLLKATYAVLLFCSLELFVLNHKIHQGFGPCVHGCMLEFWIRIHITAAFHAVLVSGLHRLRGYGLRGRGLARSNQTKGRVALLNDCGLSCACHLSSLGRLIADLVGLSPMFVVCLSRRPLETEDAGKPSMSPGFELLGF
jgi:hypothetical protein